MFCEDVGDFVKVGVEDGNCFGVFDFFDECGVCGELVLELVPCVWGQICGHG